MKIEKLKLNCQKSLYFSDGSLTANKINEIIDWINKFEEEMENDGLAVQTARSGRYQSVRRVKDNLLVDVFKNIKRG